jgi:hypothetical protein
MKKFEVQEQEMADQEQRHRETLYEAERKFTIGKDRYVYDLKKTCIQGCGLSCWQGPDSLPC